MALGPFWPSWISFGASVVFAGLAALVFYGAKSQQRQGKFIIYIALCVLEFTVSPALAFGQTAFARNDGIMVQYGRYVLFAIGHPFIAAFTALLFTNNRKYCAIALGLGAWSAISNMLMALTPSVNGGDDFNALIVWTLFAFLPIVLLMAQFVLTALGFLNWLLEDDETDADSNRVKSTDGSSVLSSRTTLVAVGIVLPLLLALYPILTSVGPDAYRVYTNSFNQQFWYICLCDGLMILALTLAMIFINDDGLFTLSPFRLTTPGTQSDLANTTLSALPIPFGPNMAPAGPSYGQPMQGYAYGQQQPSMAQINALYHASAAAAAAAAPPRHVGTQMMMGQQQQQQQQQAQGQEMLTRKLIF